MARRELGSRQGIKVPVRHGNLLRRSFGTHRGGSQWFIHTGTHRMHPAGQFGCSPRMHAAWKASQQAQQHPVLPVGAAVHHRFALETHLARVSLPTRGLWRPADLNKGARVLETLFYKL